MRQFGQGSPEFSSGTGISVTCAPGYAGFERYAKFSTEHLALVANNLKPVSRKQQQLQLKERGSQKGADSMKVLPYARDRKRRAST